MSDQGRSQDESEFDWIQLQKEVRSGRTGEETSQDKFVRKFKENPLVPLGCLVTLGALTYGLWSFRQGKQRMSQYMMRLRIGAQGFTLVALIVGIGISASRGLQ